jgi:chromosome segregation ATPase
VHIILPQFSKEKDDLSDRVKYLNDELNDSKLERDQLKSLLASEETKFKETFENLQQAKIEYETSLTRLELELEESRKRQKNISTVTGYEKKELRKVAWDLESKLEAAKYELLIAKKDYLSLKNEAMVLQAKLTELQVSTDETIAELEEQLQADRMFYARSKQTSKNRIENLVQKFVRRIERRRRKADDVLKQSIS